MKYELKVESECDKEFRGVIERLFGELTMAGPGFEEAESRHRLKTMAEGPPFISQELDEEPVGVSEPVEDLPVLTPIDIKKAVKNKYMKITVEEDVETAMQKVNGLLKRYNSTNASSVPPDQYENFLGELAQL